jgi:hypothetical protein
MTESPAGGDGTQFFNTQELLPVPLFKNGAYRSKMGMLSFCLLPDNLIQPLDHLGQFFRADLGDLLADSFYGEGADLADLDPGLFGESGGGQFEGERKTGPLGLAG